MNPENDAAQPDAHVKYEAEMGYWRERHRLERQLGNAHYRELMLSVSGLDAEAFSGRVVADFGSGPRGSLEWLAGQARTICIDVLVDEYVALGINDHRAIYVRSSETEIPLPRDSVDILFSINSLDHATDWKRMLEECIRVLRPGGVLAMSVNIDEPPSPAEPNTLRHEEVLSLLEGHISVGRSAISNRASGANKYQHLYDWAQKGIAPPAYNGSWGIFRFSGIKVATTE